MTQGLCRLSGYTDVIEAIGSALDAGGAVEPAALGAQ